MFGINKYKSYDLVKLSKKVKRKLSDKRYMHTIGVTYTAASLAMKYECDLNHVMTAGLLHDCAKNMTADDMISYCNKNKIELSDTEKINPELLHAKVGSVLADKKYGIKDEEILSAIRFHTTGKPDMSMMEKIIYVADFIEPGRTNLPNIDIIRKTAFTDIDKALVMILKSTLSYLKTQDCSIDSLTQETYDHYVQSIAEEN